MLVNFLLSTIQKGGFGGPKNGKWWPHIFKVVAQICKLVAN